MHIECRINAEDPRSLRPCPGVLSQWIAPSGPGVRVDSHMYAGCEIPPFYDSLMGKLIVHGRGRDEAVARMSAALQEMVADGVQTNLPLHRQLMRDAQFLRGGTSIHYLEQWMAAQRQQG